MAGFEPGSCVIGSDRAANYDTTTFHLHYLLNWEMIQRLDAFIY